MQQNLDFLTYVFIFILLSAVFCEVSGELAILAPWQTSNHKVDRSEQTL